MECQKCGSTLSDREDVCPTCGTEIDSLEKDTTAEILNREPTDTDDSSGPDTEKKDIGQLTEELKTTVKPIIKDISTRATKNISVYDGAVRGVVTYVISLFFTGFMILGVYLIGTEGDLAEAFDIEADIISIDTFMQIGVIFYSAHNSVIKFTEPPEELESMPTNYILASTDFLVEQIDEIRDINNALWANTLFTWKLLFVLIPIIIFISAYQYSSSRRKADEPFYTPILRGASITAGYLLLSVIGSFVFSFETEAVSWTPKLGSAILMVGLLYPIGFGSLGGAAASVVPRLRYSLSSSIKYGLVSGITSIVGILSLTTIAINIESADTVELIETGLFFYAYSTNYTLPTNPTYELPKFFFGLVIVGSVVLAGSLASRNYRTSLRHSVASGMSISLGFSMIVMLALFIMLLPLNTEPMININDDLVLQPVRMLMYGGIIYPAIVGGLTAIVQYYRK